MIEIPIVSFTIGVLVGIGLLSFISVMWYPEADVAFVNGYKIGLKEQKNTKK